MCTIALAWGQSPQFPLVIAANRDEWYARPTAPLAWWVTASGHTIAGGRDLQDGGTWMGFAPSGRFAMLTNVRNSATPSPLLPTSRGGLVVDWLGSSLSAEDFAAQCELAKYAGFNLLLGDWAAQTCHYLTNQFIHNKPLVQVNTAQPATKYVAPGLLALHGGRIYVLSNAALDTPWPKSVRLGQAVQQAMFDCNVDAGKADVSAAQECALLGQLQRALQDTTTAPPQSLPSTGVPQTLEEALSSVFVRHPAHQSTYGTRTSWCAVLGMGAVLTLNETTHLPVAQTVSLSLDWSALMPSMQN